MNTRNIVIFIGTFVAGALIALVVRAAMFEPEVVDHSEPGAAREYAAMVSNPLTPAKAGDPKTGSETAASAGNAKASPAGPHAHQSSATENDPDGSPVNTVCAICGMNVDPQLETLEYQGKTVGFGCKLCAPKFKADPERYGPLYLKNEVIKR